MDDITFSLMEAKDEIKAGGEVNFLAIGIEIDWLKKFKSSAWSYEFSEE